MFHNPFLNGILFIWSCESSFEDCFVLLLNSAEPIANEGGSLLSDEQLIGLLSPTFSGVMVLLCIATYWTWAMHTNSAWWEQPQPSHQPQRNP